MKIKMFIIMAALVASASLSWAKITDVNLADDGDGVMTCTNYGFTDLGDGNYEVDFYGSHNIWDAGHILGDIITDTELDPTLALYQDIDNDTGYAWGDYHVTVTMNKSFNFSNVGVFNSGWTFTPPSAPVQVGTNWIGSIDYYAGTPVLNGGILTFNYSVTFIGSAKFCEELMPSPVPEPGTFALVTCGLAGLLVLRRRFAS
jgi:hypothetical protein